MTHRLGLMTLMISVLLVLTACNEQQQTDHLGTEGDSLINAAYKMHDYERILSLADLHQLTGSLSELKASYWRGYAYSRLRKMRMAEMEWKRAIAQPVDDAEALKYYAKSANRLAGLLNMKLDYEGTMRVAMPAIQLLKEREYTMNTDYANLQTFMGNCQLKLGKKQDAANSYSQAYECYLQTIDADDNIANYTSSIAGIITITDAYIQTDNFEEANEWADRFDSMLKRYRQHPQADDAFYDKQWARLNFYRGCILEGLGRKEEALKAYQLANNTRYAKTADGQIEATNYLTAARRWDEAADKFSVLEQQLARYDMKLTLDNIQTYLLPKYQANVGAHRMDSAVAVGTWICNALDSAIVWERRNSAQELATIYDLKQKESEFMEQKAFLQHQRFLTIFFMLLLVIIGLGLFIFFRHRAAVRLENAFRRLEVANARAEESSHMKSNFIQQISHEIRTPLNILSGFTQVITMPGEELDDDTRAEVNRQIMESTNRITGLVNKMLELSDANSQTVIERNDQLSPEQMADEAVDASGIAQAGHLTFDLQMSPEAKSIVLTTNHHAAVRALSLLLDNARKFTAPAEARQHQELTGPMKHATLRISADNGQVLFTIEDDGIGIPPNEADHIFEEFVQLDEYYDGTGIGLTVARSLARRLGGDIQLDADFTPGARFVLTLPYTSTTAQN
jgi:signal transduction histidine kinase